MPGNQWNPVPCGWEILLLFGRHPPTDKFDGGGNLTSQADGQHRTADIGRMSENN
jgi:hypothetical protein